MALDDLVGHARRACARAGRVHQLLALAIDGGGHQLTFAPSGTGRSGIRSTFSPLPFVDGQDQHLRIDARDPLGREVHDRHHLQADQLLGFVEVA